MQLECGKLEYEDKEHGGIPRTVSAWASDSRFCGRYSATSQGHMYVVCWKKHNIILEGLFAWEIYRPDIYVLGFIMLARIFDFSDIVWVWKKLYFRKLQNGAVRILFHGSCFRRKFPSLPRMLFHTVGVEALSKEKLQYCTLILEEVFIEKSIGRTFTY